MESVPKLERDVKALARAFLILTDTPRGVMDHWKEREAAKGILAHLEGSPVEVHVVTQDERDWLLFLFRGMVGEDVF